MFNHDVIPAWTLVAATERHNDYIADLNRKHLATLRSEPQKNLFGGKYKDLMNQHKDAIV